MKKWLVGLGCMAGLAGTGLAAVGSFFLVKHSEMALVIGGAEGPASAFVAGRPDLGLSVGLLVGGAALIGVMVVCLMKS